MRLTAICAKLTFDGHEQRVDMIYIIKLSIDNKRHGASIERCPYLKFCNQFPFRETLYRGKSPPI